MTFTTLLLLLPLFCQVGKWAFPPPPPLDDLCPQGDSDRGRGGRAGFSIPSCDFGLGVAQAQYYCLFERKLVNDFFPSRPLISPLDCPEGACGDGTFVEGLYREGPQERGPFDFFVPLSGGG